MSFIDWFRAAPPVSRTLVAATLTQSVLVHGGLVSGSRIIFYRPFLLKLLPEIWRLVTPFLLTGSGMSFLFDLYFLWTYSSGLELNSGRFTQPGDFFTYVVFVCSVIILTSGLLLNSLIFTPSLLLALCYTYALDNRGRRATFMIIPLPVEYLPWAMLGFTLVMAGWPAALQQGTGIVAAHGHDFLTRLYPSFQGGRNYVQTPAWVRRAFGGDRRGPVSKGYGTAYRPGDARARQGGGTGSSSGGGGNWGWTSALGGSWGNRGRGRVLGSS